MVVVSYSDGTFDLVAATENAETGRKFCRVFPREENDEHLARATNWQLACLRGIDAGAMTSEVPPLQVVPRPRTVELGHMAEAFTEFAARVNAGSALEDMRHGLEELRDAIASLLDQAA
jgi:DNA-binding transcriptional MocR family regulator